ncbi:Transcriptional regulator, TetR family [Streptomyces sp. YIM 130001]|uniref:TetR/AcrR family transcriptional regulator n=1 Tax=Streptomyces sp. YIM 130001 TaxID=2259644 RepID=UPI000E657B55|nr:TetR/AcrR family transcriptional regulator [Streptomyces sp. YIM 130001]RII16100.1 Transcriptional regulator, TetR family [Streptomyces sp. YIM 130001]
MPAARETLLDAAATVVGRRPWAAVRMVEVAAIAGVSRQTLYNEFGGKDGLARALVRRETDRYLAGVDRALAEGGIAGAAEWTVAAARQNAVVRALLTGCWGDRLPSVPLAAVRSTAVVPAQRRVDGPLPAPGELVGMVRDRAVVALGMRGAATPDSPRECEVAVRLAVSCVVAPLSVPDGGVARLVTRAVGHPV